jgi:phage-related protein
MRTNHQKPTFQELIEAINWDAFISFVVFKTIPFFWIPAHTVTFTLPIQYRVAVAADLSIILGVILVHSHRRNNAITGSHDTVLSNDQ